MYIYSGGTPRNVAVNLTSLRGIGNRRANGRGGGGGGGYQFRHELSDVVTANSNHEIKQVTKGSDRHCSTMTFLVVRYRARCIFVVSAIAIPRLHIDVWSYDFMYLITGKYTNRSANIW